jgi:hypothetical protein
MLNREGLRGTPVPGVEAELREANERCAECGLPARDDVHHGVEDVTNPHAFVRSTPSAPSATDEALRFVSDAVVSWAENQTECPFCGVVDGDHEVGCLFRTMRNLLASAPPSVEVYESHQPWKIPDLHVASASPGEDDALEHMMDGYLVMEQIDSGQRRHIGISTMPDDRTPEGERVRVFRLGSSTPVGGDSELRRALEGLLQHSHLADADPEDVDEEDRELERAARRALAGTPAPSKPREKVWSCKIGGRDIGELPYGADGPMRTAVSEAYQKLTGREDEFCFSGWGGSLDDGEREVAYPQATDEKEATSDG